MGLPTLIFTFMQDREAEKEDHYRRRYRGANGLGRTFDGN